MGRAKQKRNRKIKKGERVRFDLQNSPKKLDGCLCLMILLALFSFVGLLISFIVKSDIPSRLLEGKLNK